MITPQPYQRFDYKTPGAAQAVSGRTPAQYQQTAQDIMGFKPTTMTAQQATAGTGYVSPVAVHLANNLTPAQKANSQALIKSKSIEQPTMAAQKYMTGMGLTPQSTPQQLAAGLDSYQRYQQQKNQMPKNSRGFMGSTLGGLFKIGLPMALGAAFAPGAMAALGPAGKAIQGAGLGKGLASL